MLNFVGFALALLTSPLGTSPLRVTQHGKPVFASMADPGEALTSPLGTSPLRVTPHCKPVFTSMSDPGEAVIHDRESAISAAVAEVHRAADSFAEVPTKFSRKFTANLVAKKRVETGSAGIIDECLVDEGQVSRTVHARAEFWKRSHPKAVHLQERCQRLEEAVFKLRRLVDEDYVGANA